MSLQNHKSKKKKKKEKRKKTLIFGNPRGLCRQRQKVLNTFESGIFPIEKQVQGKGIIGMLPRVSDCKVSDHSHLKVLTPSQILQRLTIALAQVIAGNTSENLLNEIHQIIHSLYWAKEITKKVYNNIMNSLKL